MIKKIVFLFIISTTIFTMMGCKGKKDNPKEDNLNELLNLVELPTSTSENLTLPTTIEGYELTWKSSNLSIMSDNGIIYQGKEDIDVNLTATIYSADHKSSANKNYIITIRQDEDYLKMKTYLDNFIVPTKTSENIVLPTTYEDYIISWTSYNLDVMDNAGLINRSKEDKTIHLSATITCLNKELSYTLSYDVIVEKYTEQEYVNILLTNYVLPTKTKENLSFISELESGYSLQITSSDVNVISNEGVVTRSNKDVDVKLNLQVTINNNKYYEERYITVEKYSNEEIINFAYEKLIIPTETYKDLIFPTSIDDVTLLWSSSNKLLISNTGVVKRTEEDGSSTIYLTLKYNDLSVYKSFVIVVKGFTNTEKLQQVADSISFNEDLETDLVFGSTFDYGVIATYESSNKTVLSNTGIYTYDENILTVSLEVTFSLDGENMKRVFHFNVLKKKELQKDHLVVVRANDFNCEKFNNVELKNNKLVLKEGELTGFYESEIINTMNFSDLVGSWAAVSSINATVELQIKVLVNDVWSDYISYKPWGLGLQNAGINQTNSYIKLSTDELIVLNSKEGNGIIFKVTLRRKTIADNTPVLSLVAFALNNSSYTYNPVVASVPNQIEYSVPRLRQGDVPVIGGSICSATSTTMLLKHQGMDFSSFDSLEHRYIAGIVKDYGHNIYGNWVYNTVTMGAYGFDAYVGRFYSINELVLHLATVGPVALSVKGTMTSDQKSYTTNGHLIVAIGYKYEDGKLSIICNDPNVNSVRCVYTESVIKTTWRGIVYIIEK